MRELAIMATSVLAEDSLMTNPSSDDDYGSDFSPEEEQILEQLLSSAAARVDTKTSITDIEDNPIVTDVEYHASPRTARFPRVLGRESKTYALREPTPDAVAVAKQSVLPDQVGEFIEETSSLGPSDPAQFVPAVPEPPVAPAIEAAPDTRSPIERFRTKPRKAFSVTDLVSPAWCELQYWYTLTKHGRKPATAAMKAGTAVHKELEDQIYTTVEVKIITKEDSLGLRIWNVIQGLRTLRETGQTRELEVWGQVEGYLVTGVIDEVSFICPDTELEDMKTKQEQAKNVVLEDEQTTLADYFKINEGRTFENAVRSKRRSRSNTKVYLCDVKTRGFARLPNNVSFRPTKMQLMLYHRLMSELVNNKFELRILAERYGLDVDGPFSDSFIAQIGSLNDAPVGYDDQGWEMSPPTQDSMTMLLEHNSLSRLWGLMITEFQRTLRDGKDSVGSVLKAEYRTPDSGDIIGSKTFLMDEEALDIYLGHEMKWWKGEREAEGVVMEEAYKCKHCEFAPTCEWRLGKVEEAKEKSRASKRALKEKKWSI